ncbi:MAG TPA: hypothetical protein VIN11_03890 [Roseivirga sp.]
MKIKKFKLTVYIILAIFTSVLVGCSAKNYPQNEEGVYQAQSATLGKDAIRLKGRILSKAQKVSDRLSYEIEVMEVLNQGATFAAVEPRVSERVILYTTSRMKLKRNSEVIFDALSPLSRGADRLVLNMIVE